MFRIFFNGVATSGLSGTLWALPLFQGILDPCPFTQPIGATFSYKARPHGSADTATLTKTNFILSLSFVIWTGMNAQVKVKPGRHGRTEIVIAQSLEMN